MDYLLLLRLKCQKYDVTNRIGVLLKKADNYSLTISFYDFFLKKIPQTRNCEQNFVFSYYSMNGVPCLIKCQVSLQNNVVYGS